MKSQTVRAISYMTVGYGLSMALFATAFGASAPANAATVFSEDLGVAPGQFSQLAVDAAPPRSSGSFVPPKPEATSNKTFDIQEIIASVAAIPEPNTWSLMVAGFGIAGLLIRRRRVEIVSFS